MKTTQLDGKAYTLKEKEDGVIELIPIEKEVKADYKRWRAKYGGEYWTLVSNDPVSLIENATEVDSLLYSAGLYFQTQADAEEARNKQFFVQEVLDWITEKNEGWKPDYSSEDHKYRLRVSSDGHILISRSVHEKCTSDDKVMATNRVALQIIEEFDNKKLIDWFI